MRGSAVVPAVILAGTLLAGTAAFGVEQWATTSCSSTSPCQIYANSSSGSGVKSTSSKGFGAVGTTANPSTKQSNGTAGLLGEDLSSSGGYDVGVTGTSTRGRGVFGSSAATNTPPFTYPKAGVVGVSTGKTYGLGVYGSSPSGPGVFGLSSTVGAGVEGMSTGNDGVDAENKSSSHPALFAYNAGGGPVFWLDNAGASANVLSVDSSGNTFVAGNLSLAGSATINGSLTVSGGCTGCAGTHKVVQSYATRASEPVIEDFGEMLLQNGRAHVRLDSKYASAITQYANYLVFITPEGDTHELYVTNKSLDGFDVREAQGGRSSVAFSYRIVARPYGKTAQRLPVVTASRSS